MKKCMDAYKEVRVFEDSKFVIRVHIPDLTDDERTRRMKQIEKAAEALMREVYKRS